MGISYSVEVDEERTAKAMGRELSISKKDAVEVCREVKGMPLQEAREKLRAVADGDTPIPRKRHNAGVGHRSDLDGWDAGSFPKKATEKILDVLYNAVSNAENQGYDPDEMTVQHIAAHKVGESRGMKPRAMGRASQWNGDLVDIEVVVLQEDYDPEAVQEEEEEPEEEDVEETEEEAETEPVEEETPDTLTDVEGIGESKAEDLRDAGYESVEDLQEATQDDIAEVDGIGNALAARVKADAGGIEVDDDTEVEEDEEAEADDETENEEEEAESETEDESDTETDASEDEEEKGGDT